MLRATAITIFCVFLSGCAALPIPLRIASWAADGISYATTNKSVFDHGLSAMNGKDCAVIRVATEGNACRNETEVASDSVEATVEKTIEASFETAAGSDSGVGALAYQPQANFRPTTLVCDVPQMSVGMPTKGELYHCAQLLIDRHGRLGALDQSDLRIAHFVRSRDKGGVDIWVNIKLVVRQLNDTAPKAPEIAKRARHF